MAKKKAAKLDQRFPAPPSAGANDAQAQAAEPASAPQAVPAQVLPAGANAPPAPEPKPGVWAVVELFGHQKFAGRAREVTRFGAQVLELEVFTDGAAPVSTHYWGGSAIFGFHPCSEAEARGYSLRVQPVAVHQWELAAPVPTRALPAHDASDGDAVETDHDEDPPYDPNEDPPF